MHGFERIPHDPKVMGGKPCIRGMRVTVGMVAGFQPRMARIYTDIQILHPCLPQPRDEIRS